MYFRNKFDEDFLYLCNQQPKCKNERIRLSDVAHQFWMFRKFTSRRQSKTIHVIPLLMFNEIKSDNPQDINIDNYMMICKNKGNTIVTCNWNEHKRGTTKDSTKPCNANIKEITGDLNG